MKHLKKLLPVFVVFTAFMGIITAYAITRYQTVLEIGAGYSLTGSSRYYEEGIPAMQFTLQYFVKYKNQNYSKVRYEIRNSSNKALMYGTFDLTADHIGKNTAMIPQGRLNAGNYKWYYTTKVNGTTYSGFYMNPVYLYTL